MNPDSIDHLRHGLSAARLPVFGFMGRQQPAGASSLADIVFRINGGDLVVLCVPPDLIYRLACLCGRWAPELQEFVARVLGRTGNLDYFLTQPAATDHHRGDHGLLATSISAAELVIDADHDARSRRPLPATVGELQQVCSAAAFLFDVGKVFTPKPTPDFPRAHRGRLAPHVDVLRCWRWSWEELAPRNPVLAGWLHQLGREAAGPTAAVRAARRLTRNAVVAAWSTPDHLPGN